MAESSPETPLPDRVDRDRAFTRLVDAEGAKLLAFGRRFCGDGSDAEDLVQETFTQAFRSFDQLTDPARARAWLYTIARHACQRMHRKRAGEPARLESLDELLPRPSATLPEVGRAGDRVCTNGLAGRPVRDVGDGAGARLEVLDELDLDLVVVREAVIAVGRIGPVPRLSREMRLKVG